MTIRSKKLRDSAKGEACTLNIVGVCSHDPATTVLAHLPDESGGGALKSDDISACYACHKCHDVIDGRIQANWQPGDKDFYMRRAQTRTLRKMIDKGLIIVDPPMFLREQAS